MVENMATVSNDDILAAYRMFLGRKPSPQEIKVWLGTKSLSALRAAFISSSEFTTKLPGPHYGRLPRNLEAVEIEWQTDPRTAQQLLKHVKKTWTAMGESRPHWSVLSSDMFLPQHIAENERAFFASGEVEVTALTSALQRHDCPIPQHILEYGCGVGRVTAHLAAAFPRVTASDISPSHLMMARQNVNEYSNVTFKLVEDDRFAMTESFDAWISYIVLQHNPPPIIAMILHKMFTMLAPGGVALFQVPTYSSGYQFSIAKYLDGGALDGGIEVHCLPQWVVFHLADQANCVPLEVREDEAMGPPSHWRSNTFLFRKSDTAPTPCGQSI